MAKCDECGAPENWERFFLECYDQFQRIEATCRSIGERARDIDFDAKVLFDNAQRIVQTIERHTTTPRNRKRYT